MSLSKPLLSYCLQGASAVESCLNDVCDQLEADAPPRILRERVQACEKNDVQYTKQLLCHLQGLGVDLEAMPSVVKWQDHQEHDLPDLQACSSAQGEISALAQYEV